MSQVIDAIIKIGGSAVTDKNKRETLKPASLQRAVVCIQQSLGAGTTCIIVHGAGSFGHHHAKEFEVNKGFSSSMSENERSIKMQGYSLTRQSVQKLNQQVVNALVDLKVPAVGCSPGSSWLTNQRQPVSWPRETISRLLMSGLVPVLHGDCCMDDILGCCILSGDTVIKTLCASFEVKRVVFLTDVAGVFDRPPSQPNAALLKSISVKPDGTADKLIGTSQSPNDVTGGILLKLKTAFDIILQSQGKCPVFVCAVDSEDAQQVISLEEEKLENIQCTRISMSK